MEKYKLKRSGKPPLAFEGEKLAEAGGKWQAGRELNRWHDITAYRTVGGRYILQIEYHSLWQGEEGHDFVEDADNPGELAEIVLDYDPIGHAQGFPPGAQFEEKQARMVSALRAQYDTRISEVLSQIPGAEEVIE